MRSALTLTLFLVAVIIAGTTYVAHGFHKAKEQREAVRAEQIQAELERQRRLAFPLDHNDA